MVGMDEGRSLHIMPGDTWNLSFAGVCRHAKVMERCQDGWWRCIDTETGLSFLANEQWFADRLPDDDSLSQNCPTHE